jgi:hypothetical protein
MWFHGLIGPVTDFRWALPVFLRRIPSFDVSSILALNDTKSLVIYNGTSVLDVRARGEGVGRGSREVYKANFRT